MNVVDLLETKTIRAVLKINQRNWTRHCRHVYIMKLVKTEDSTTASFLTEPHFLKYCKECKSRWLIFHQLSCWITFRFMARKNCVAIQPHFLSDVTTWWRDPNTQDLPLIMNINIMYDAFKAVMYMLQMKFSWFPMSLDSEECCPQPPWYQVMRTDASG